MYITDQCMIIHWPQRFFPVENDFSLSGIIFPYGERFFLARNHFSLWRTIFPCPESFFLTISVFSRPRDNFYSARNGFSCSTNDFSLCRSHFSRSNNDFSRLMNDFFLPGMVSSTTGTIIPGEKRFLSMRNDFSGNGHGISRSITLFTNSIDFFLRNRYIFSRESIFFIWISIKD